MALTLTVDAEPWRRHLASVAGAVPGLVPVIKGNGYGLGLERLAAIARDELRVEEVAVGTVHELASVPAAARRIVLTPETAAEAALASPRDVLTVGRVEHVQALGPGRSVLVKLASSMRRYGADADELGAVLAAVDAQGATVHGMSIHLPLAGSDDEHAAEVEAWLPALERTAPVPLYVSHLSPRAFGALQAKHPGHELRLRLGTALWLGDKSSFHLHADVADVRPVRAGEVAGYRAVPVAEDGYLVMVTAGSAHGVAPLPDGRSPFHFARRRLALLEPPHMHTSMCVVPAGDPCPGIGDQVDVQRPLTQTHPDVITFR